MPRRRRATLVPPRPARILSRLSPHRETVTASASRLDKRTVRELQRLTQEWQSISLSYYDKCGEARFPANFHGDALSQIRLYPGYREGTEIEETDDEAAVELIDRIRDPGSADRTQFQASYGRLMFLTGEGYALVTKDGDDDEAWEFVSSDELRIDNEKRYRRIKSPGATPQALEALRDDQFEPLDERQAVAYRMWRRHPRYSGLADSPMHSVLDLFEELVLLQLAVRARVKSRLASSGILAIAKEISLGPVDALAAPENPKDNPWMKEFIEHVIAPIANEGTASAFVPYLLEIDVPPDRKIGDLLQLIKLHDPNETYRETGLRMEVIKRIAIGIDLPPEILLGMADSNHWTAWQVDDQVAKAHIFPVARMLCNDLTSTYLRPLAKELKIDRWEDLVVGYDAADLVVNPDQSSNARELYDRHEISGDTLRDAHGFTEDDKPTDEDRVSWETARKPAPVAEEHDAADPEGRDTPQEPPENPDMTAAAVLPIVTLSHHAARIVGAGEMALERARERAGAAVRRYKRSCPDCFADTDDVPNRALVAALGPEKLAQFDAPAPAALVAGGCDLFAAKLTQWGVPADWTTTLVEQIERHAARTLFEPEASLPPGFEQMVERLPEAA